MKYTHEQIRNAVPTCFSIRQLLLALGLADRGSNYKTIKTKLQALDIDTSHFTGQGHAKGKLKIERRTHASEYLTYGSSITSYKLKLVLLRDGLLDPTCSCCGGTEWLGGPIPLELDHINGDNADNRFENLRLLCPNCHALTPTYRGKNQKRAKLVDTGVR